MRFHSWSVLVGLTACGGGSDKPVVDANVVHDAPSDSGSNATTMNVHGTGTVHHISSSGITDVPIDFSAQTFTTVAGADMHSAMGTANGTFDVPVTQGAASWLLEYANKLWLFGNSLAPDFGYYALGRADAVAATMATPVTLSASGLDPWADGDLTEIFTMNTGTFIYGPETTFATPIAAGATSFSNQTIDWKAAAVIFPGLPVASKGDSTTLVQLTKQTSGATPYLAVTTVATASATLTDGQASSIAFTASPVTRDQALALHWKGSALGALASQVGPGAALQFAQVSLDVVPAGHPDAATSFTPDLATLSPSGTTDLDLNISYGNPFSGTDVLMFADVEYRVPVTVGSATARNLFGGYSVQATVASGSATVTPTISGVQHVTVGGKDVSSATQTGVGTAPSIAWQAPAVGTPTEYRVIVWHATASNGKTVTQLVTSVSTASTSIPLPAGTLTAGETYVVEITASDAGVPQQPNVSPPGASFTTVSATFTP